MKTRIINLLELNDDPKIKDIIKKTCKDNPITIYTDYRDFENIEKLVTSSKTVDHFIEKIDDSYMEYVNECEYELFKMIKEKLLSSNFNCDDLSPSLITYIQDYIYENCEYDLGYDEYLNHKIKVNLFLKYKDSNDMWDDDFDRTSVLEFLRNCGYTNPKTILKNLLKKSFTTDDKFLDSLRIELFNMFTIQINTLCFIGEMSIKDYYKLKSDSKATVTLPVDVTGGLVDPYNGGGSVLNFILNKPVTIKATNVDKIFVENGDNDGYTVDQIYGLTSSSYKLLTIN